jgi:hypothetical protein
LTDLAGYLGWLIDATATGALDKDTSSKLTYALTALRGALMQKDLEHQVKQLRAELAEARKAPGRRAS